MKTECVKCKHCGNNLFIQIMEREVKIFKEIEDGVTTIRDDLQGEYEKDLRCEKCSKPLNI